MKWLVFLLMLAPCANATHLELSDVEYYKKVRGYFAHPHGRAQFPAVILIHEWWGMNEQIKRTAERLALEGYAVLAVDLYNGKSTEKRKEAKALADGVKKNMKEAFANLKGAIKFLNEKKAVIETNRIASIGWCFGGGWALEIAKNNLGVKASVVYYGRFNPKDDFFQMRAKLQGHFGKKDKTIRYEDVVSLQANLKTENGEHEIFIYPNSGHAFFNENSPNYNGHDARIAWKRTLKFLKKFL